MDSYSRGGTASALDALGQVEFIHGSRSYRIASALILLLGCAPRKSMSTSEQMGALGAAAVRPGVRRTYTLTKITLSESALMELRTRLAQSDKKGVLPWLVWIATATRISSANEKPKAPQEGWGMDLVAPVDGDSRFVRTVNGLEIGANEPILAQKHITELHIDFQDGDFVFNGEPGWRRTWE